MDPPDQESLAEAQNSLAHPEIAQNTIMPAASKTSMPPPRAETRAKPSATQHQVGQPKAAGPQVQVVLCLLTVKNLDLIDLPVCRQHPTSSNEGCCRCCSISCPLDPSTAGTSHQRSCLAGIREPAPFCSLTALALHTDNQRSCLCKTAGCCSATSSNSWGKVFTGSWQATCSCCCCASTRHIHSP